MKGEQVTAFEKAMWALDAITFAASGMGLYFMFVTLRQTRQAKERSRRP